MAELSLILFTLCFNLSGRSGARPTLPLNHESKVSTVDGLEAQHLSPTQGSSLALSPLSPVTP